MIAHLKPYAEYKESGLPWLGDIPLHWEPTPNRAHLRIRKLPVGQRHPEYQLLSLTKRGVIVRDLSENRGKFSSDMGTSQEVRVGDLVFCLFDVPETPRTVGLSRHGGMITGAYTVMECADPKIARFFEAFYIAMDDRKLLSPLYSGLRNTIPKVRFLGAKTPLPPPDEQAAIVRFLDWANGRLERAIRAKRKVIALLNEQKQAIIHCAVTRGLDPSVPLKPSGVPWLGDIPRHWEVRKLRQLLSRATERNRPDLPLLSVVREMGVIKRDTEDREGNHNFIPDDLSNYKVVRCGQVAMNKMKAWQGSYGVSEIDGIVSPAYFVFDLREVGGAFFHTAIRSKAYVPFFAQASDGVRVGQWDLTESRMKEISFFFPPVDEQVGIVQSVARATSGISAAISRLEREIALLREYRTRLVADVVTGKLDVRAAAAQLPAEDGEDEQEALDEDEATLEELSEGDVVEDTAVDEESVT
jgi:type I restriction enzyme S subunit